LKCPPTVFRIGLFSIFHERSYYSKTMNDCMYHVRLLHLHDGSNFSSIVLKLYA
jgi:hypothetical protein